MTTHMESPRETLGGSEMRLRSEAFLSGGGIPRRHTAEGSDISPALRWSALPEGSASLALIVQDPDAPTPVPWVHWVIYNISADEPGLPEAIPAVPRPEEPYGAIQGRNSWDTVGYRGPFPPRGHGPHRYHFTLYALDATLELPSSLSRDALMRRMAGHILGTTELIGIYER